MPNADDMALPASAQQISALEPKKKDDDQGMSKPAGTVTLSHERNAGPIARQVEVYTFKLHGRSFHAAGYTSIHLISLQLMSANSSDVCVCIWLT